MTSTELALNRTLTDILEDELYNMHAGHGGAHAHPHGHALGVVKSKNVLELPLPLGFDEHSGNDTQMDGNGAPSEYNWARPPALSSRSSADSQSFNIFNKYADPSLTTTSMQKQTGYVKAGNRSATATTPVQKTVNLHSVMKIANPFNNMREQLPYDVKVTNDIMDGGDFNYSSQSDDELIGYDTSFDPKAYWPLQDSSVALSNEDARMIFDHEFAADDDDLSEDEDEEDEHRVQNLPLEHAYDSRRDRNETEGRIFNSCNFVDSNMVPTNYDDKESSQNMTSDFAVVDEEDEDDNMVDEDDLYEPSLRNNRKESVVFNNLPSSESQAKLESTPPITPVTKSQPNKAATRRKLSSNVGGFSPSATSRRKTVGNKRTHQSPAPLEHVSGDPANGTEIYTCKIMNHITEQPCSAQFSRSYDLTRHQNTIHAKKKAVFRCSECISSLGQEGYQKTFSRLDALTRHIKSKHETLSLEQRQEVTRYARDNIGYVVG